MKRIIKKWSGKSISVILTLNILIWTSVTCVAQQVANINQVTVVRQKITPVKVSANELKNIKSSASVTNVLTTEKSLPGAIPIEVTSPRSGDIWEAGKDYVISWRGATEDVIIELISEGDLKPYSIVGRAPNSGSYTFRVPYNWLANPYGYYVRVKSLSGKQSGNSGSINVFSRPVDLECRIVDAYIKSDVDNYIIYADSKAWLEFNVLMRNKGVTSPVTIENILVRIIKEPEEIVVYQEEWGFSGIYGREWYKLPELRKYDLYSFVGAVPGAKNLTYRVEVELDPQNRLGESQLTRSDNKSIKRWQIK